MKKNRILIYVEGGGKGIGTQVLRRGFDDFLKGLKERARPHMTIVAIPSGGKDDTRKAYEHARRVHRDAHCILLIDSDESEPSSKDGTHWMTQAMEAWFLADHETLTSYYGVPFRSFGDVERMERPKERLKEETRKRKPQKGEYQEIRDGGRLLSRIAAERVRQRASHCHRLLVTIEDLLSG